MKKFSSIFPLVALAFLGTVEMVKCQDTAPSVNTYTQTVTREILASGYPAEDQGQVLELVRYTIPSGANLPPHIHPGMQIERVEFGTLTYTIVKGTATIVRANGTQEILQSGHTTLLQAGDSLVEPGGMVHYGKMEKIISNSQFLTIELFFFSTTIGKEIFGLLIGTIRCDRNLFVFNA